MDEDRHYRALEKMYLSAPINDIFRPRITVSKERADIEIEVKEIFLHAAGAVHGAVYFKMLEIMAEKLPMDEAVNGETGAFLGTSTQDAIYNAGEVYDCSKATEAVKNRLFQEDKELKARLLHAKEKLDGSYEEVREVRNQIDGVLTQLILEDLGYEFRGTKFKFRKDERTPSAKVYPSGFIKDYGTGKSYDILDILYEKHGMDFSKSLD